MSEISAAVIKQLRESTGAGMMDCKKALTEAKGNYEEAVDWLRKKGLAAAGKKSGRTAAEGLVAIAANGNKAAIIELNSETDFVARNDQFQALAKGIAEIAANQNGSVENMKSQKYPTGKTVEEEITSTIATIGENINFRRTASLSVGQGVVSTYVHSSIAPNLGKIGVIVALESTAAKEKLEDFGKKLAMHIAASRPEFITAAEVTEEMKERQRKVFAEQAETFMQKFAAFDARVTPYKGEFKGERNFSEKQIEAKLDELNQFSESLAELKADFEKKSASEDRKEKQEGERTKKLIDVFYQEAAFLIKKVTSYGDKAAAIQKLVDMKMARYFEEAALLDQLYVIDGKTKVSQVVEQISKEAGAPVAIKSFIRFQLGEGIEKEQADFASEVAKAANG